MVLKKVAQDKVIDQELIWYLRPFFQFLFYHYFRVKTIGLSNIPLKKPAIIVANHAGTLPYDAVMINLAVFNNHKKNRPVRFLVHDFVFNLPFVGNFIKKIGGVRASPANAIKLLSNNELILVFPEGVKGVGKNYDKRYKLQKFGKGGFVRTAIKTNTPIIPAAVIGSEEIHPIIFSSNDLAKPLGVPFVPITPTFPWLGPLGLVPLPSKWQIIFGKPVSFDKYKPKDAENKTLVNKKSKEIKNQIQKMIDVNLKKRKSIWK